MRFMQIELVLQAKNRSEPAKNRFSVALLVTNEPPHDKTNKVACVPSEDSDLPGHPPSLISLRSALNG